MMSPMQFLEYVLAKWIGIERLLANLTMKSSQYSFSQDYVFDRSHLWSQHLGELKGKENVHLLEIGSYEGRSAIWFLEHVLTHPSSTITCVDPFFSRMAEIRFDHNMAVSRSSQRMIKIKNRSQEVLKFLKENSYDVVYIDGSHRAVDVQADASLSWPLLKPGGFVIFDDYLWNQELPAEDRPQMAVDKFLTDFGSRLEVLHKSYQVIVKKV